MKEKKSSQVSAVFSSINQAWTSAGNVLIHADDVTASAAKRAPVLSQRRLKLAVSSRKKSQNQSWNMVGRRGGRIKTR